MTDKRILVTGGTGFIGSHTTVVLLELGHDVVIYDNLSNSKATVVDRIESITGRRPDFIQGDILDDAALTSLFSDYNFDAVIHFAGLKAVGESVAQPERYHETNVEGSQKLYSAMAAAGVKTLIFSSSATVYGPDSPVPYTEDMPLAAVNPYGQTKIDNENILRDYCAGDPEWRVVLLRYFNPGGAHVSGLIGEDPKGIPNNLLPYVARVASGEYEEIHVFGDDYDTVDGTGVRDYIHVMDLARGHVLALDLLFGDRDDLAIPVDGADLECQDDAIIEPENTALLEPSNRTLSVHVKDAIAVNLGTGKGTSVLEIIHAFEKACGRTLPYVIDPRRPGDLPSVYADVSLAHSLLGFETKYGIEDICADAWRWQQKAAGL